MMEFVSWDDYPIYEMESHKNHVPNHQPEIYIYSIFINDFPIKSSILHVISQRSQRMPSILIDLGNLGVIGVGSDE